MTDRVCYRASESSGDPALAPPFAAGFMGAGAVAFIAAIAYSDKLGSLGYTVALGLGVLMALVGLSFVFLLKRTALFATATADEGLLIRKGHGTRVRIPWSKVIRVLRTRPTQASTETTLHILFSPRRRIVLPPGEGQDDLYDLAQTVLDRKTAPKPKRRQSFATGVGADVDAGHSPVGTIVWALVKMFGLAVGVYCVAAALEREAATERALLAAVAFLAAVPLSLLQPSASSGVTRASARQKGLSYQSLVFGKRLIPWERLALARVTTMGRIGRRWLRFIELYDVEGGRLLMPFPPSREFLRRVDEHLGSRLSEHAVSTHDGRRGD